MFVLMVFIAIPEIIFLKMGLSPEKMSIIPFLLVWIGLFFIIYLGAALVFRGIKYIFHYLKLKLQKNK